MLLAFSAARPCDFQVIRRAARPLYLGGQGQDHQVRGNDRRIQGISGQKPFVTKENNNEKIIGNLDGSGPLCRLVQNGNGRRH